MASNNHKYPRICLTKEVHDFSNENDKTMKTNKRHFLDP